MTRKLRQKAIVHRKTMDLCCRRRWRILVSQVVVVFTTKPKNYAAHAFQEGWSVDTLLLVLKISMEWPFHNMKGVCENWALDRPLFKLPKMLRFGSGPQSKSSKKLTQTFTSIFCVWTRARCLHFNFKRLRSFSMKSESGLGVNQDLYLSFFLLRRIFILHPSP